MRFRVVRAPRGGSLRERALALPPLFADEPRPRVLLGHGRAGALALELAARDPSCADGLILHAPLLHPWRARLGLPERTTSLWLGSLPEVTLPAAVLWGERDPTFSTSRLAAVKRVLPAAFVSLPGRWGGRPMRDDPAAYGREVAALARKLLAR